MQTDAATKTEGSHTKCASLTTEHLCKLKSGPIAPLDIRQGMRQVYSTQLEVDVVG